MFVARGNIAHQQKGTDMATRYGSEGNDGGYYFGVLYEGVLGTNENDTLFGLGGDDNRAPRPGFVGSPGAPCGRAAGACVVYRTIPEKVRRGVTHGTAAPRSSC
jgi:hypothetical protein